MYFKTRDIFIYEIASKLIFTYNEFFSCTCKIYKLIQRSYVSELKIPERTFFCFVNLY